MASFDKKQTDRIRRTDRPGQRGAAAVEFAIIFPLLVLLLFAMIEFGLYLFNQQVITNACREGARAGIVARPERLANAEIEQVVRDYSQQHLVTFGADNHLTVTLKDPVATAGDLLDPATQRCASFSCELEVQASFTYSFLFLSTIGIDSRDILAVARMRME